MVSIKNIFLKYVKEYYALYNINIDIKDNEKVAFVGERESGKTSLIRLIAKLEQPTSGEIFINGKNLKKINYANDFQVGYLPEKPEFFENMTVYDNLKYILKVHKVKKNLIDKKINDCLINFNIESIKDLKVKDLSLFQKYLLSFARFSFRKIELLLLDDFFDEISTESRDYLVDVIRREYLLQDCTVILSTKNIEIAKSLCSHIIEFKEGSIIKDEIYG